MVDSNSKIYQCTKIAFIKKLVRGYKIEVSSPHNFFITEREILVHNFLPIIVTLSFSFDFFSSITLSGFGLFVGIFEIYNCVNKTHRDAFFIWKNLCHDRYLTTWNLPGEGDGWVKLPNGQGWKDPDGNIWKRDHKHKDTGRTSRPCPHWDVSNKKGKKIREVDYDGKEIWPNGPKNKNKKS